MIHDTYILIYWCFRWYFRWPLLMLSFFASRWCRLFAFRWFYFLSSLSCLGVARREVRSARKARWGRSALMIARMLCAGGAALQQEAGAGAAWGLLRIIALLISLSLSLLMPISFFCHFSIIFIRYYYFDADYFRFICWLLLMLLLFIADFLFIIYYILLIFDAALSLPVFFSDISALIVDYWCRFSCHYFHAAIFALFSLYWYADIYRHAFAAMNILRFCRWFLFWFSFIDYAFFLMLPCCRCFHFVATLPIFLSCLICWCYFRHADFWCDYAADYWLPCCFYDFAAFRFHYRIISALSFAAAMPLLFSMMLFSLHFLIRFRRRFHIFAADDIATLSFSFFSALLCVIMLFRYFDALFRYDAVIAFTPLSWYAMLIFTPCRHAMPIFSIDTHCFLLRYIIFFRQSFIFLTLYLLIFSLLPAYADADMLPLFDFDAMPCFIFFLYFDVALIFSLIIFIAADFFSFFSFFLSWYVLFIYAIFAFDTFSIISLSDDFFRFIFRFLRHFFDCHII